MTNKLLVIGDLIPPLIGMKSLLVESVYMYVCIYIQVVLV